MSSDESCDKCHHTEREKKCDECRGPRGKRGCTGPTGAVGPRGIQGVPGPQGAQGPAGANGATGPAGPDNITQIDTGFGLTGGPITSTGTIAVSVFPAQSIRNDPQFIPSLPKYQDLANWTITTSGSGVTMTTGGASTIAQTGAYEIQASCWYAPNANGVRGLAIKAFNFESVMVTSVEIIGGTMIFTYAPTTLPDFVAGQTVTVTGTGMYDVTEVFITASNGTSTFTVGTFLPDTAPVAVNGTATLDGFLYSDERIPSASHPTHLELNLAVRLNAGTTLQIQTKQDSGVNLLLGSNGNMRGQIFSVLRLA